MGEGRCPLPTGGICLKSYILAIVLTMFLSALFAFQNIGDVTIRFLIFEWTLPQGVWEVVLFSSGAAIMWFFSLFSVFEVDVYKRQILDGEGAKYLNSPESRIFNKRHNLYLLDKAKASMNAKGHALLVERCV